MANTVNGGSQSSVESLNGSWVKLDGSFRNGSGVNHSPVASEDGAMEDLLAEAVEEQSKHGSSGKQSPTSSPRSERPKEPSELKTGHEPILPQEQNTDWIWEWSSRIEVQPHKEWKMQHPVKRSRPHGTSLSLRGTKFMKGAELMNINFYVVVPAILVSHLIAFGIGVYIGRRMVDVDAM